MIEERCFGDWLAWHRAELHSVMLERLLYISKHLQPRSVDVRLAFVRGIDWPATDSQTRLVARHEINPDATKLRERLNLSLFDDGTGLDERQSVLVISATSSFRAKRKYLPARVCKTVER
jgi:hypothetical protein